VILSTAELHEQLRTENIMLTFDTNITTRSGFSLLCKNVQIINSLQKETHIRLSVSAVVHAEMVFHLAQLYGNNFNLALIREKLVELDVEVLNFTFLEAEYCAKLLQQKYNTPPEWQAAKKRRCLECVGLPHDYYPKAIGTGDKCGAPNDWLIMAQAQHNNMILVTEDKGKHGEFSRILNITRYNNLKESLNRILTELTNLHQTNV